MAQRYRGPSRSVGEPGELVVSGEKFARDFVAAWDKVMSADRFDLR